jgi:glutathione-regulated potassium-efflux system protein KefB
MPDGHSTALILPVLIFLAAAVIAVPFANRIGLGSVVGYLLVGVVLGPSVLGLARDPETTLGIAELGVVMLLFVIGLELKPARLLTMRRDIVLVGGLQMLVSTGVLMLLFVAAGLPARGALVLAFALALSATSICLRILEERGDLQTPYGKRSFAVLLLQDMAIVPALAILPLLADGHGPDRATLPMKLALAVGALALIGLAGRYLLNPLFRLLARSGAREVMTAAALFVVLGAALLMQTAGMSMALGAFLAGLLLAESDFRHQLEADIEPFRGLLLGLFFMSVGMTIDLPVVIGHPGPLLLALVGVLAAKALAMFVVARVTGSGVPDAVRMAALLSPAGEFAFVLIPLTVAHGLLPAETATLGLALAALTMIGGPLLARASELYCAWRRSRRGPVADYDLDGLTEAKGSVLVIGFGRFGQLATQALLAGHVDVIVIDSNVERIRSAAEFGFKVYYGDGTRLDVLRAAGAEQARLVAVCIDDRKAASLIVELVRASFPLAKLHVRAYDRIHALELMAANVDFILRETAPAALAFGREALLAVGFDAVEADAIADDVGRRDEARLLAQQTEGRMGGVHLLYGTTIRPEPLTKPKARAKSLSMETEQLVSDRGTGAAPETEQEPA